MRHKPLHNSIRALACAALLASAAQAAELGDIAPRSYIGQPLAVDIELVALAPEEVNGLQVRLAQADVYRGANVTMNPALSSVRMEVVKREQRQYLHVTTTRAVNAEYVHLYVTLGAAGRQDVRLATVWLQADPNPAPPPAPPVPLASAMTPAQAEQIAAQARAEREAAAKAAAAATAAAPVAPPVRDRTRPAPMPSVHESEVGTPGALRAAVTAAPESVRRTPPASVRDLPERIAGVLVTPGGKPVKPSARQEDVSVEGAVPLPVAQALLPLPPLPLPKGVKRPASPAACAPAGMSAKECVALDNHNTALSNKLVELEGRMKALQGAVGGAGARAARAPASLPAPAPSATAAAPVAASAAAHASAAAPAAAPVPTPAPAKAVAHASVTVPDKAPAKAAPAASAPVAAPASAAVKAGSAAASASGHMEPEAHAAKASATAASGSPSASASASAASASEAASVPAKQVRVLPKLKYKKEKPAEKPADYTLPLAAGGVGLLALAGAGLIYLRKRKAGSGPLKIWQGFRKKKTAEPKPEEAQPLHEVTPESLMQ
jgi:pilus assembly protein FimV